MIDVTFTRGDYIVEMKLQLVDGVEIVTKREQDILDIWGAKMRQKIDQEIEKAMLGGKL